MAKVFRKSYFLYSLIIIVVVVGGIFAYFSLQKEDLPGTIINVEGAITDVGTFCYGTDSVCDITVKDKMIIIDCSDPWTPTEGCPPAQSGQEKAAKSTDDRYSIFYEGDKVRVTAQKNKGDELYNLLCATCSITKIQ